MSQLDSREFVLRNDPSNMYGLTVEFGDQCRKALSIAEGSPLPQLGFEPGLVMLTGLGGSAAGGDFLQALFEESGVCPFLVNRDYSVPSFVDQKTLVFAVSYSGNTEETLAAYEDAKKKGARIICVTSGGKLAELAAADGNTLIQIPSGQPPRTALGYLFIPVAFAAQKLGLIGPQDYESAFRLTDECASQWSVEVPESKNASKQLAAKLNGGLPILYGLGSWQGQVARRWKAQINENAKTMTWARAFPELCHNEVLGWVGADDQGVSQWHCVVLQDGTESKKMQMRAQVTAELISDRCEVHTAQSQGESLLEKMLSLTLLGDFVSLYMAALNDVDPENIDSINVLKARLAEVK